MALPREKERAHRDSAEVLVDLHKVIVILVEILSCFAVCTSQASLTELEERRKKFLPQKCVRIAFSGCGTSG